MTEQNELKKKFDDFESKLPNQLTLRKSGPGGKDIVLPKKKINGVVVYATKVQVPFLGGGDKDT